MTGTSNGGVCSSTPEETAEWTLQSTKDAHSNPWSREHYQKVCWVQAAHLLSGLTVAVWWRPPSSGFALFTQAPKEKAMGTLSRWSLILQDYRRIRQLVLGKQLGDGRNLNAAGGG